MNYSMIASGLALLVALVPGPGTIHANETGKKIAELANKVYEELKQLKVTEVGVEGFNDTGRSHSSAGPLIQSRLMDELKKLDVTINPKANVYITGEFLPDKRPEEGHLGVKLICILREKDGEVVKQFTTTLGYKSNEDVVKLLALSVDFTEYVKADSKERNEHLKKQQEEPPAYTQKDKIKVRKDSPFAVEILAAKADSKDDAFKHRPGKIEHGYTQVSLHKGEEYRIKLCNTSKHEIAVSITIDGLDAFEFFEPSEGKPTSFLVGPGKERIIKGWMVSTSKDDAFIVGSLAESAAAKLFKPSNVIGTITVCIHPAWEQGKAPPEYDGSKDVGTGRGRPLPSDPRNILKREIGPLLEAISIRYNKNTK